MSVYNSLLRQIEDLRNKAEEARIAEKEDAVRDIKLRMDEWGITIADLDDKLYSASKRIPAAIKYMEPSTGKTWTGLGRAPRWMTEAIASGKTKEQFLLGEVDRS